MYCGSITADCVHLIVVQCNAWYATFETIHHQKLTINICLTYGSNINILQNTIWCKFGNITIPPLRCSIIIFGNVVGAISDPHYSCLHR